MRKFTHTHTHSLYMAVFPCSSILSFRYAHQTWQYKHSQPFSLMIMFVFVCICFCICTQRTSLYITIQIGIVETLYCTSHRGVCLCVFARRCACACMRIKRENVSQLYTQHKISEMTPPTVYIHITPSGKCRIILYRTRWRRLIWSTNSLFWTLSVCRRFYAEQRQPINNSHSSISC